MAPSTIHVKATSGAKITLDVELSTTVEALKSTLSAEDKANVPAPQQRLIYRGHVLKDDRTLDSYGTRVRADPAVDGIAFRPARPRSRGADDRSTVDDPRKSESARAVAPRPIERADPDPRTLTRPARSLVLARRSRARTHHPPREGPRPRRQSARDRDRARARDRDRAGVQPSAASIPSGGGLGGFGAGPFGGLGGMSVDAMQRELQQVPDLDAMQRELQQNPEVMRQMLNSPFMRATPWTRWRKTRTCSARCCSRTRACERCSSETRS